MADSFRFGFDSSFQHVGVSAFGKYHTLRIATGRVVELAGQLRFLSHQFAEMCFIIIPVLYILTGNTTLHSGTGHGDGYFRDQAGIYRFRNKIFRTEGEVVHMVGFVHYIGYGLFGQIGNGVYSGNFHLFIDRFRLRVESSAEDIRETDYIINLIGIIRTSGCHQYVRAGCHGVFVRDFRGRVCQGKDDRHRSHATHHILRQSVSFGES